MIAEESLLLGRIFGLFDWFHVESGMCEDSEPHGECDLWHNARTAASRARKGEMERRRLKLVSIGFRARKCI